MSHSELHQEMMVLVAAELGEFVQPDLHARLEHLLETSEEARQIYVDHLDLHASLFWERGRLGLDDRQAEPVAATQPATADPARTATAAWSFPEHWQIPTSFPLSGRTGQFSQRSVLMWIGVLLLHVFLVLVLSLWLAPRTVNLPLMPVATVPQSVASLSAMRNVHWSAGTTHGQGDPLPAGSTLAVESGLVEVAFQSGAQAILQGPAQFTVVSANSGELLLGALTAQVPYEARGFSVKMPAMNVVDLGTEFVAKVDSWGQCEVHVISGAVESTPVVDRGDHPAKKVRLLAGEALRFNTRTGTTTPLEARGLTYSALASDMHSRPYRIRIQNPSFEEGVAPAELFVDGIPGWQSPQAENWGVHSYQNDFLDRFPDGRQMGFLNEGQFSQVLRERLAPATRYDLSLWIGHRLPGTNPVHPHGLRPDYCVELCAGDEVLASSTNGVVPASGKIERLTLSFATPASHPAIGQRLQIRFRSLGSLASNTQTHFDQVELTATPAN